MPPYGYLKKGTFGAIIPAAEIFMLLPSSLPQPPDETLMGLQAARTTDKSLIDRAITRELVSDLPAFLSELKAIALSPDSKDSDKLSALIQILDRAAGKPSQTLNHTGVVGNYQIPQEEVERRLAHLRGV